jgi:hypothetical protein
MINCSTLLLDDEWKASFTIDFGAGENESTDWDSLRGSNVEQQLRVCNLSNPPPTADGRKRVFELARTMKSRPEILNICFESCVLDDLQPLWLAVVDRDENVRLEFEDCRIGVFAAEALRFLLEKTQLEKSCLRIAGLTTPSAKLLQRG